MKSEQVRELVEKIKTYPSPYNDQYFAGFMVSVADALIELDEDLNKEAEHTNMLSEVRDEALENLRKSREECGKLIEQASTLNSFVIEEEERADKATGEWDRLRKALEHISELQDDKCQEASAEILYTLLDLKVGIARQALKSGGGEE